MARDYFNELLAKYNNIFYPSSSQRQFDTLRNDLRRDILTPQFEQARMEYQNMLAGTGSSRRSVDATEGGEQQQIIINPTTGATEIVTPEYNRQFRTDNLDFNPGGASSFENIYDANLGSIDPNTGLPYDEEAVAGLIDNRSGKRDGDRGGDRDLGSFTDNRSLTQKINDIYGPYSALKKYGLGLLNPMAGVFGGIANFATKKELADKYGISTQEEGEQFADVFNDAKKDGLSDEEAGIKAAISGGGTYTDETFKELGIPELSINEQLKELEKKLDKGKDKPGPTSTNTDVSGGISDSQKKAGGSTGGGGNGGNSGNGGSSGGSSSGGVSGRDRGMGTGGKY